MSLSDFRACCGSSYVRSPMSAGIGFMCAVFSLSLALPPSLPDQGDVPKFGESIQNVTIPVGREAVLSCVVDDLSTYKVAWLRVDTQTILTIHGHVITKNHRIGVTHSDHRSWYLHIRDVRQTDRGWYMCQINTDPMKSQTGFLEVVVPPDILDYPTSTDMVVREGSNVTMRCAASGSPTPSITWRREDSVTIPIGSGQEVTSIEGAVFNITRVNRLHMGAYLCIASNGVPPTVSKRIMLIVHFPPMIWIQNQLVGASDGQQMTLECHSEAYPKSINYWTREKGEIISHGEKYEPELIDNAYKVHMKLTIRSVSSADYGAYKCVSKNSLGDTDGSIKLYRIPVPTTAITTVETTQPSISFGKEVISGQRSKYRTPAPTNQDKNDIALIPGGISHTQEHRNKETESFNRIHKPTTDQSRFSQGSSHILVKQTDTVLLTLVMSTVVSILTCLRQIN